MADTGFDPVDDAQWSAEEAAIQRFLVRSSQDLYLGLWHDDEGYLCYEVDTSRVRVLLDSDDYDYATYKRLGNKWVFVAGTSEIDHDRLLGEFLQNAEKDVWSTHPARRAARR